MKVLILSCSTGQGHNSVSEAITEQFLKKGIHCETLDALNFISSGTSKFLSWGHNLMYRYFPKVFKFGYSIVEKNSTTSAKTSNNNWLIALGAKNLSKYCEEFGFDHIICTHIFSALMLTEAKKEKRFKAKTYFVATDYDCSPGTLDSDLDCYFIPDDSLKPAFKDKTTCSVGIPIRKEFFNHNNKEEMKKVLKIKPENTHIVMMFGSMGCGPMEKLTRMLSNEVDENTDITVICGTNKSLSDRLMKEYEKFSNIHILGFTKNISQIMDSADIYVTKPGGISTTEAMAKGLPMVFLDVVSGYEYQNILFFKNIADIESSGNPEEVCKYCIDLLNDKDKQLKIKLALLNNSKNGAIGIYNEIVGSESNIDFFNEEEILNTKIS